MATGTSPAGINIVKMLRYRTDSGTHLVREQSGCPPYRIYLLNCKKRLL